MSAKANIRGVKRPAGAEAKEAVVRSGVTWTRIAVVWLAVLAALVLALMSAASAFAAYEQQSEHFGVNGEAKQLENARAVAINTSGVGGVQAGSFYVIGWNNRVVRFAPGAEGEEPRFEEAWGWGIAKGGPLEGYVRCGPAYHNKANPAEHTYEHCEPANSNAPSGGEEPGHFDSLASVAVDQTTGDVYVRNSNGVLGSGTRQHHLIEVLTAKGELVGEGFGDSGNGLSSPPEPIAEGPEKLHEMSTLDGGALAVDSSGAVYVVDKDYSGSDNEVIEHPETRVMSFEPCHAGDYESYCYAAGKDVQIQVPEAFRMALAGSDRVVVAGPELIREYPLGVEKPAAICSLAVPGLDGMTANELSGEMFYMIRHDRSIHRSAPCDEVTGEFHEIQNMKPQPETKEIYALAVNPGLAWGQLRPSGVLYAVDSENGIGDIFAPAEVSPPEVQAESVADTTTASTMLKARIDPLGQTTKYTFQYLTVAQYNDDGGFGSGAVEAPASPGEIPSGEVANVTTAISSLTPDTRYAFRVLASSFCNPEHPEEVCKADSKTAFFATYPEVPASLPDGRAYELVSPPDKNGGEVFPANPLVGSCLGYGCKPPGGIITTIDPMQGASDGEGVSYMGQPFSSTEGSSAYDSYVSRRTANGWQTTVMSPALLATKGVSDHLAYNNSLTEDVILQGNPQLSSQAPAGYENFYLQSAADPGSLTPLVRTTPPDREPGTFGIQYAGHSPDFSAQFFAANDALTPATAFAPKPPDPGTSGHDLYEWREGQFTLVNVLPGNTAVASEARFASPSPDAHGVSANGHRVFWEANGHLYVRENGKITREIEHVGTFLSASEDGLNVLLSDGCLYSLLTEECTDLTQGKGGFKGIAGAGGNLLRVYFVDTAQLLAPTSGESQGQAGQPNLYAYQAGVGSTLIATLLPTDGSADRQTQSADWAVPSMRTAEASPDGRYLAFRSTAQLTGYGNVGFCEQVGESTLVATPCAEVFLYDMVTGRLVCASCNPTGEAPHGNSDLPTIGGTIERGWTPQPRYLTDQGRLFFDSQDRLSPRDTNGRVEDVYEDQPVGVGSCQRAAGCVSLISPGTGAVDSNFLAMDENGANVFFTTRERLTPDDTDELIDLYDAREGGGFTGEGEVVASECGGEACQPTTGGPLVISSLASVGFQGAGNIKPETVLSGTVLSGRPVSQCPKGKVKEKAKCVNRKKQSKQRRQRSRQPRKRTAGHKRGGTR